MDHIRIDEGVKRGPRKKPGPKPSSPRRNNGQFIERLPNDPASIKAAMCAYQSGATLEQIGKQYGVTKQAVYGWLLGDLGGPEHGLIVTQALTARVASADDKLEAADNPLDLARARELARNARLDLERRRPALYGPKQEVTITDNRDLGERLRRARERTIEGTCSQVSDGDLPKKEAESA